MDLKIITTGGTIDKIYFDQKNNYEVGDPQAAGVLARCNVSLDFEVIPLFKKDSLDITEEDRAKVREVVESDSCSKFVITHGTDTMAETGRYLAGIDGKAIVLTGSMYPAKFFDSDAVFNLGAAVTAVQVMEQGVYIAMNGRLFDPQSVQKNVEMNRFEQIA